MEGVERCRNASCDQSANGTGQSRAGAPRFMASINATMDGTESSGIAARHTIALEPTRVAHQRSAGSASNSCDGKQDQQRGCAQRSTRQSPAINRTSHAHEERSGRDNEGHRHRYLAERGHQNALSAVKIRSCRAAGRPAVPPEGHLAIWIKEPLANARSVYVQRDRGEGAGAAQ